MSPPSRMFVAAAVLFLFESHDLLLFLPRLRALEARICHDYYASEPTKSLGASPVDELACKIPLIQSRLAMLRGWQVFLDAIPTIALATTWGYIADRIGQRVVLGINCLGSIIYSAWYFLVCVMIFASGFCVRIGLLALYTASIDTSVVSKAFAFVATLEALGGMFGGVAFQKAFAMGIRRGRGWMALPFWIGAALYLIYLVTISSVKELEITEEARQPLLGNDTDEM
ncbi:hypothetical protein CONLIGDRAFT_682713 [Coniochaeta ligniaria NRRL 30616]|uniref:MFS general substrate transporter n=1 Tax=Coniochaeta ligniaria NRRL 30616 TaxID=1408157 RepID=A0A1J7IJ44_9PEZI|nr:hypothetical protein CONLIGDRAFT_682713 [Coniochaeta ligniaria NRRL 30616]